MITDYTLLVFVKADLELYKELDTPYPSYMMQEALLTVIDYLIERDKPKRELILVGDKKKKKSKSKVYRVPLNASQRLPKLPKRWGLVNGKRF